MIKKEEIDAPFNKNTLEKKNLTDFKSKTTNVNVLLNRVRLEKKDNLKKKNHLHINHNSSYWISYYYFDSLI